jgi:hypothetical protein
MFLRQGRSILAPKMIDRFMDGIEFEVADLCNRLVDDSEKEGSVYPTPYLQLSTLNIILNITMGKRFESLDDPELSEIMKMLKANIYYEGIEMDLPNYLPILSVLNLFSNVGQEMRDHFSNSRDRIIKRLMAESAEKEEINFVKAINEEDSILDDTDKLVLLCKCHLKYSDIDFGDETP